MGKNKDAVVPSQIREFEFEIGVGYLFETLRTEVYSGIIDDEGFDHVNRRIAIEALTDVLEQLADELRAGPYNLMGAKPASAMVQ